MPKSSSTRSVNTGEQQVRLQHIAGADPAPAERTTAHVSTVRSPGPLKRLEGVVCRWLIAHSLMLLRLSLGAVFLGFGVLKFFPGVSPAQDLVETTTNILDFGLIPGSVALVVIAALECTIGLCLISGRAMRPAIYLLAIELVGILSPLVLLPSRMFGGPHHAPTLEGQYVLKDVIVVAATLVLATTLRGAKLTSQPSPSSPIQGCTTVSAHDCVAENEQPSGLRRTRNGSGHVDMPQPQAPHR
jgi:putative oxidoreductase